MSYKIIAKGVLTGIDPPEDTSQGRTIGGLRLTYQLRYYDAKETVTIQNKKYTCNKGTYWLYRRLAGWFGIVYGGQVRLSSPYERESGYVRLKDLNQSDPLWEMVGQNVSFANGNPKFSSANSPAYRWRAFADAEDTSKLVYPEGLIEVEKGTTLRLQLQYNGIEFRSTGTYNYLVPSQVKSGIDIIEVPNSSGATIQVMRNGVWVPHEINIREAGAWNPYSANIRKGSEWVPYS